MLAEKPSELLKETDQKLFCAGACHIFALELIDYFADLNYELCCMEAEQWAHDPRSGNTLSLPKRIVHVYAKSGSQLIDIHGVRSEEDYLRDYETNSNKHSVLCTYYEKAYARNCSIDELFTPSLNDESMGLMNKDRLYLDDNFVKEATSRARRIITNDPRRFSVAPASYSTERPGSPNLPSSH